MPEMPATPEAIAPDVRRYLKIPYGLRRVPEAAFATRLPLPRSPALGDIGYARVEKIGKNARLELASGRASALHVGDVIAVVFGNRYATAQFEGYARVDGDRCDLLSMGGLCGLVTSKHSSVAEPTRLRLLGMVGDASGKPLVTGDFALPNLPMPSRPRVLVVCGTSMDAGKTHTSWSLIRGLKREVRNVAGVKLTGTASGRDTWAMLDAGACTALDFIDGGFPATYMCTPQQVLTLYDVLISNAAAAGAEWVVMEIADGVLQGETATLIQNKEFASTVDAWVFAASDPLSGVAGHRILREWGIEPVAISGCVSMSPLAIREVESATGLPCLTSQALQAGELSKMLLQKQARSAG